MLDRDTICWKTLKEGASASYKTDREVKPEGAQYTGERDSA